MKRKNFPAARGVTIITCLPAVTSPRQHSGKRNRISDTNYFDLEFLQLRQLKQHHSVKCSAPFRFPELGRTRS